MSGSSLNKIREHIFLYSVIALFIVVVIVAVLISYKKTVDENRERAIAVEHGIFPEAKIDLLTYDRGDIPREKVAEKDFELENVGQSDLVITRVATSCGCTTAELWVGDEKLEIPATLTPKSSGIIKVRFDPEVMKSRGDVKRAVRIETNDPNNPFLIINLTANVR